MGNRKIILTIFCFLLSFSTFGQKVKKDDYKIQIVLLLDVSGSMGGLISQAQGQIWRMINELTKAEKNGRAATIQIALGSYGNWAYNENGHFKLHSPLTTDFDLISEQLFQLKTGGSEEYCGYAIQTSLENIEWSDNKKDLRIIFIAGNEEFNSGEVDYSEACRQANRKKIIINTIYCGTPQEGIYNLWEDGAVRGKGKYLTIDQYSKINLTETLWDKKIFDFNDKFNSTYVPYGIDGNKFIQRQARQDENARLLGNVFLRERVFFKVSGNYQNGHWDLVDAYDMDSLIFEKMAPDGYPENIRIMTEEQKMNFLKRKKMERELYIEAIRSYSEKAQDILEISAGITNLTLDNSIIETIIEQAKKNGFEFK